ncbi:MAG TPA: CoA pyrophosphatase [Longimicrobium sp.]|nr:CoA pyrophosphatase [Longimicrobium sp.]
MTDARIAALEAALASRPPLRAPAAPGQARAAVALLLRVHDGRLELLLIRRAEREGDPWSGHMALPGGRWQAEDAGMAATAARETLEEVGIDVSAGRLLGELDVLAPRSARIPSIAVSPFVYHVPADVEPRLNHEVQLALWIAVDDLMHPDAVTEYLHDLADGNTLTFPAFDARGYVVWGMTHRILTGFLELYAQTESPEPPE